MVLDSYLDMYGEAMPVDGWSIHNFTLNEVSCDYDLSNCWGASIPPGIDAPYGEILTNQDKYNMDLFTERVQRFRQRMADRGYIGLPQYLSEYGILMPQDFGFPSSRVNTFMNNTFDYLESSTDQTLGDPNDGFHLVQKWSWLSTSDTYFNGWLYDLVSPDVYRPSSMGENCPLTLPV